MNSSRHPIGLTAGLARSIARRWPALAVATVAAAVPLVAFADTLGPTTFQTAAGQAVTAIKTTGADFAMKISSGNGKGLEVRSVDEGIVVDSKDSDGIVTHSVSGPGLSAEAGDLTNVRNPSGFGVGLTARGENFGAIVTSGKAGLQANGGSGAGVQAVSSTGAGVEAYSTTGSGVIAQSKAGGTGVIGIGTGGQFATGVVGNGTNAGVQATGGQYGITASGEYGASLSGTKAPLFLWPAATTGAPGSGNHFKGELYVDSQGSLFLCVANGTPGTWKKVHLE